MNRLSGYPEGRFVNLSVYHFFYTDILPELCKQKILIDYDTKNSIFALRLIWGERKN